MKIYTRTGDTGTTALFGGPRVSKSHARLHAYGTVDELNSVLGLVRAQLGRGTNASAPDATLERIQNELFVLGADLATPAQATARVPRIGLEHVQWIEDQIDLATSNLPTLKHFILPGGVEAAATLHVARTVCRRCERVVVEAAGEEPFGEFAVPYLNRLSDLLFVLARLVNIWSGVEETTWLPEL
jgi:cob(I)alamin adenosyltransferase